MRLNASKITFDSSFRVTLRSEPKCNTPADLIIGTVDQDLRECWSYSRKLVTA